MSFSPIIRTLLFAALIVAVSRAHGAELVVGRSTSQGAANQVVHFAFGSNGDVAPTSALGGAQTTLANAIDLDLDVDTGLLWVTDFRAMQVAVFELGASGDSPPLRRFNSPSMGQVRALQPLTSRNRVAMITSLCCISFYPIDASGTVGALGGISRGGASGSQTRLDNPVQLAYSHSRDRLYVSDTELVDGQYVGQILVFSPDAGSLDAPLAVIQGPNTGFGRNVFGLAIDEAAGELYAISDDPATAASASKVLVFDLAARGDALPLRELAGPNTRLSAAYHIALDRQSREMTLTVGSSNDVPRIQTYPLDADGDIAPRRTIIGPATGLGYGQEGWGPLLVIPPQIRVFADSFEEAANAGS